MIICGNSNIDIIQGVIGYGNVEGITDWRIQNTSNGVFNIMNSSSIIQPYGGISEIGQIPNSTDRYMIFKEGTSTFYVPPSGITCDVLVVGGGGGGGQGNYENGGGGAGGIVYMVNKTFVSGIYNVIVGKGGAPATVGEDSSITLNNTPISFDSISIVGKGGGAAGGGNGGSGAGGNKDGGLGISTQGNTFWDGTTYIAGGFDGQNGGAYNGGGGGGGGEAGGTDGGLEGGDGRAVSITGSSVFYGGGGAGGGVGITTGGSGGGGGTGDWGSYGGPGTPNTGGGGGGAYSIDMYYGGTGGSGIVILRYSIPIIPLSIPNISIIDNGNIGIGTTPTASSKLEILGDINISGNYKKNNIDVISSTSNYVLSTSNIFISRILNELTLSHQWTTNSNMIYYNTSNIGIGTTNPITKLHLYDDVINETILTIQHNLTVVSTPDILPYEGTFTQGIITGSTDKYIIFTAGTSTFTVPSDGIECDILMIGGGGGGSLGGGGAGACIVAINQILTKGTYNVSVGTGGTGGNPATVGNDSSISLSEGTTRFLAKGGGNGGFNTQVGPGGCGGGGGYNPSTHVGGLASTTNIVNGVSNISPSVKSTYVVFGTNGGTATNNPNFNMAGGGGIGAAGGNYTGNTALPAGSGGNGLNTVTINGIVYNFKTWFSPNVTFGVQDGTTGNYFIGGGGGGCCSDIVGTTPGSGGKGGGGNGGDSKISLAAISGTVNTGSGGGGKDNSVAGSLYSNGGSGIIIIRYRNITSSSIELIRGNLNDSIRDYKIGNYDGDFIIKSSLNGIDTNYVSITGTTGAIYNAAETASWTTASDKRIKENIERASYDKCFEVINKLELNRFNYIKGFNTVNRDITQLGFIAQEVKEIFPKSIFENIYINDNINISDLQSIDITQINYSLYGAVKKLIEIINDDEEKIKRIESLLNIDIDSILTSNLILDTISSNIDILSTSNIDIDSILTSNIT